MTCDAPRMLKLAVPCALLCSLTAQGHDVFGEAGERLPLVAWEHGLISSGEPRLGVPTFFWAGPGSQQPVVGLKPEQAARRYLIAHAALYRTTPAPRLARSLFAQSPRSPPPTSS